MSLSVDNLNLASFAKMVRMSENTGKFATSIEKTSGGVYVDANGKLHNVRGKVAENAGNAENNKLLRQKFYESVASNGATVEFLKKLGEQLGLTKQGNGYVFSGFAQKPLERREIKQVMQDLAEDSVKGFKVSEAEAKNEWTVVEKDVSRVAQGIAKSADAIDKFFELKRDNGEPRYDALKKEYVDALNHLKDLRQRQSLACEEAQANGVSDSKLFEVLDDLSRDFREQHSEDVKRLMSLRKLTHCIVMRGHGDETFLDTNSGFTDVHLNFIFKRDDYTDTAEEDFLKDFLDLRRDVLDALTPGEDRDVFKTNVKLPNRNPIRTGKKVYA